MKKLFSFIAASFLLLSVSVAQQKVIQLYEGKPQGSEDWDYGEGVNEHNAFNIKAVYNVTQPTLTLYSPTEASNTGTAVVIAPGGGFHFLSIDDEGTKVAEYLKKKGVTCFLLKYRLAKTYSDDPVAEWMEIVAKRSDSSGRIIIPMAIADARKAIAYIRDHADEYRIDKNKIGIIGFSAGGTVAAGSAFNYTDENKPDFVAPVYPYFPPEMVGQIPSDAPPLFVAAATDDALQLAPHSLNLYKQWSEAGKSAELHLYSTGNHGFGMRVQHLPSDAWIDRFTEWLRVRNLLEPLNPPGWAKNLKFWQLDSIRQQNEERVKNDWANFSRYKEANAALATMSSGKPRVVFMGNSITDAWINVDSSFFAGKDYIDRGISGQTTPQMLLRFRPDVIDLKPAVVVILAGINDIAGNTGPMTLDESYGNIVSMTQLARAAGIRVVVSSVLPAYDFPWSPGKQPADKVIALNRMLRSYCEKNNIVYLDYHTAMKDERNGLPKQLSGDGVHPTLAGYKMMEPMVEKAIAEALKKK